MLTLMVFLEPHLPLFTSCVVPSHTDPGVDHVTGFKQDINKDDAREGFISSYTIGLSLWNFSLGIPLLGTQKSYLGCPN